MFSPDMEYSVSGGSLDSALRWQRFSLYSKGFPAGEFTTSASSKFGRKDKLLLLFPYFQDRMLHYVILFQLIANGISIARLCRGNSLGGCGFRIVI